MWQCRQITAERWRSDSDVDDFFCSPPRFDGRARCIDCERAAEDIAGSTDHPLLGRYKDASIVYYKAADFDELVFLKAPHDYGAPLERNATDDRLGPEWLTLQGRATEIRYEVPAGRSSLEVLTNYDLALKAKGFQTVFTCADKACFKGSMNDLYLFEQQLDPTNGLSTAYSGHARYLLSKLDRPEGHVYASVFAGEGQWSNGRVRARARSQVHGDR